MEDSANRRLDQWAGARDGWVGHLPLKKGEGTVELDASALRFAVPTFLLRLRTFVEWHLSQNHDVIVRCPKRRAVATYMARMQVDAGLPDGVFEGLPIVSPKRKSDVLIPITRLREFQDVDELGELLLPLFIGHDPDVAVFADAMHMATSELCGNGVEHGANPLGCYVAAQRYESPHRRTVLAVGDLGQGIPRHLKRQIPDIEDDRRALQLAVRQGVTGTGDDVRGNGFYWVMKTARESRMRYATLDVRSGNAHLRQRAEPGRTLRTGVRRAPFKKGTWATLELGPAR